MVKVLLPLMPSKHLMQLTNFALDKIDAQPLLTDAAGFDKLMGKGSLNWNLTTTGQSQKALLML